MINFRYKVSVIIPVYNCAEYLEECTRSLSRQTMKPEDFEIIFVNDGSSDESGKICAELAKKNSNIVFIDKENGGVSSARNRGIEEAQGKYFVFLDADDTLSADTLKTLYEFFEKHYDETDLVTYKIIPHRDGQRLPMHYRYKILEKTGIYDLNEGDNCYIAQSTMNICVKNRGKGNNILFDTSLRFHEDQKYV
ncbi:MAG: glycosyltransferase family 2 protein, partial [Clostridia bacterium]|nr:glycosyltransferase family 2 protein [Clostridia bacterium]